MSFMTHMSKSHCGCEVWFKDNITNGIRINNCEFSDFNMKQGSMAFMLASAMCSAMKISDRTSIYCSHL